MVESLLKLRDNYYISIDNTNIKSMSENANILNLDYYDIQKKSLINREILNQIKSNKPLVISINVNNKSMVEKAIKDIRRLKQICKKNKINFGIEIQNKIIVANIEDYNENQELYVDILHTLNAILYENIEDKYNYLYDSICDYLDSEFIEKNICGFKNDKCKVKEKSGVEMGCCYHCKNKYFGLLYTNKFRLCEYLKDKRCSAKCITCKLYTCSELQKQGIKYNTKNVLLIKYFFNPIQKFIIISSHFTPKEKIMKRIIRYSFGK